MKCVKIQIPRYKEPLTKDMAICIPFFNPAEHVKLYMNLSLVLQTLTSAKIPWFVGEVAFMDRPWFFGDESNIYRFRSTSYMFYKEQILNQMIQRVPEQYTKICILDGDILFEDQDWYANLSEILDTSKICQPFFISWLLDATFITKDKYISAASTPNLCGHPGYVWGFDRKWITQYPLPEFAVLGIGDFIFLKLIGSKQAIVKSRFGQLLPSIEKYIESSTMEHPTFLKSTIYHLYHGTIQNRQYPSRYTYISPILERESKRIEDIFVKNGSNLYEWIPELRDELNTIVLKFFVDRQDDL